VDRLGVDLLSIGAHKFYGPKGVGALFVRGRTPLQPQMLGGSQEKNRRAGTENVACVAGMARAMELAYEEFDARNTGCAALRNRLLEEVPARVPYVHVTGPKDRDRRLSNSASFCFEYIEGEAILMALDLQGVAASSGSACTSGSLEPSHVLTAMGLPLELARGSLRLTVGKDNTREEIDYLLEILPGIVSRLRALSPTWPEREAATNKSL
jgi:cysteine desulfurase